MTETRAPFTKDFFVYEADIFGLAPGGTATTSFIVQADSEFQWQVAGVMADIAGASQESDTVVIPLCTVQITDTGSGRNLFNIPVPIPTVFGQVGEQFVLPVAKIFAPNSSITLTVSNYDASETYNLRMSFIGQKLFYN